MPAAKAPASIGKRVGGALYLHVSALPEAEPAVRDLVEQAARRADGNAWNVAKVEKAGVSLLLYEDFDGTAFPALLTSVRIDREGPALTHTDYRGRDNPPILHRKETLLLREDPRRPAFAAVTRLAEEKGLFAQPHLIGVGVAAATVWRWGSVL